MTRPRHNQLTKCFDTLETLQLESKGEELAVATVKAIIRDDLKNDPVITSGKEKLK